MSAVETATGVATFRLAKGTGTYADALAAFGLQQLLLSASGVPFTLVDAGDAYELRAPAGRAVDLDALDYDALRASGGYRYIRMPKDDSPAVAGEIDYADERRRLLEWRAARKPGQKLTPEDTERLNALKPMPNWPLYQNVNVLQGFGSYVKLHQQIREADPAAFREAVAAELAHLAGLGPPPTAPPAFAAVSAVQAFNPTVGKGVSGVKPKGTGLGGLPGAFVDWFAEWLRYIGLGRAATSVAMGDDIKMYVAAPKELDGAEAQVVANLMGSVSSAPSSAKADVLLSIGLARALIANSDATQPAGAAAIRFRRRRPNQLVAGLHTAYFKSLGQSRALSNISFIGLPGWFPVEPGAANLWLETLDDHTRVLRALDEERTEEANLLTRYRDFLTAGPELIPALLRFLGAHAVHVFHARERGRYAPPLRMPVLTEFLRKVFMDQKPELAAILDDEGFRHVAAAIRRATVSEQFQKANRQQEYEIHYGLLQELERKARFKDQFVAQLADFIVSYNSENARKAEQAAGQERSGARRRRPQVTTDDIARVIRLLDEHNSETVAMLLLAFAAASDPRTAAPQETAPPVADAEPVGSQEA